MSLCLISSITINHIIFLALLKGYHNKKNRSSCGIVYNYFVNKLPLDIFNRTIEFVTSYHSCPELYICYTILNNLNLTTNNALYYTPSIEIVLSLT
ncbi:hypothetical protein DSUL_160107 [Desulfovibrionales bacterium]